MRVNVVSVVKGYRDSKQNNMTNKQPHTLLLLVLLLLLLLLNGYFQGEPGSAGLLKVFFIHLFSKRTSIIMIIINRFV